MPDLNVSHSYDDFILCNLMGELLFVYSYNTELHYKAVLITQSMSADYDPQRSISLVLALREKNIQVIQVRHLTYIFVKER